MIVELVSALRASAKRAANVFSKQITVEGYPNTSPDLAVDYKHPLMWITAGDMASANIMLDHIRIRWLRENGDFRPKDEGAPKSANPAYQEFYAYPNGWIVRAAHKAGREDISSPGLKYLLALQDGKKGGFYTHAPEAQDGITDVITTAHLGLVCLEAGHRDRAVHAGNYLCDTIERQPSLKTGFYLRRDVSGECIVEFPSEAAPLYMISKTEPKQLYFMIAYPIAYLVELHKITGDEQFLVGAKLYAEFALSCHESVLSCEFSHKLAWALSELYCLVSEPQYLEAIKRISDYFISMQDAGGLWFSDDPLKCYDQSAEIVCWFLEISKNLEPKKKLEVSSGCAFFGADAAEGKEQDTAACVYAKAAFGNTFG